MGAKMDFVDGNAMEQVVVKIVVILVVIVDPMYNCISYNRPSK